MSEQWKSITGIEELEQRATQAPQFVNPSPQFGKAVPQAATAIPQAATGVQSQLPADQRCQFCSSLFAGQYFLVGGQAACSNCADEAKLGRAKDNQTAYVTSLITGSVGALVGLALYSGFAVVTHFYYGAFAVGWLIGAAMIFGSKGIGGLRYQVTAALLTYVAISLSAVPIWLAREGAQMGDIVARIPLLFVEGLASPILNFANPVYGLIRLAVLGIGIRIAWRQTRAKPLAVNGPYSVTG